MYGNSILFYDDADTRLHQGEQDLYVGINCMQVNMMLTI